MALSGLGNNMGKDDGKWNLQSACNCIVQNGGKADPYKRTVSHPKPGIKILGVMDYLCNHQKFIRMSSDADRKEKRQAKEVREVIVQHKRKTKEID